jgi:hypothetical protein
MTENGRPAPLVPAEVDLRGLPFMPLDVVRLLDSDLFALSNGDEFKAAVALWCKSWSQHPGGSLPDDDRVLAHLTSTGPRWRKVKAMAMRGWVLCSDGRWYHPVVAEKAVEAWEHRQDYLEEANNNAERQRRWRERQKALSTEIRELGGVPPRKASLEAMEALLTELRSNRYGSVTSPSQSNDAAMPKTETGTETGTGTYLKPPPTPAFPVRPTAPPPPPDETQATLAGEAAKAMREAGVQAVNPSHPDLLDLLARGVTAQQLGDLAAEVKAAHGPKPMAYVLKAMQGRLEASTHRTPTPEEKPHVPRATVEKA